MEICAHIKTDVFTIYLLKKSHLLVHFPTFRICCLNLGGVNVLRCPSCKVAVSSRSFFITWFNFLTRFFIGGVVPLYSESHTWLFLLLWGQQRVMTTGQIRGSQWDTLAPQGASGTVWRHLWLQQLGERCCYWQNTVLNNCHSDQVWKVLSWTHTSKRSCWIFQSSNAIMSSSFIH